MIHNQTINITNSITNQNDTQSIQNKMNFVSNVIKQRTMLPLKCNKTKHKIINIDPMHHNWAPYYFRCNFLSPNFNYTLPVVEEVFITKELVYKHVYKAKRRTIYKADSPTILKNLLLLSSIFIYKY